MSGTPSAFLRELLLRMDAALRVAEDANKNGPFAPVSGGNDV